MNTHSMIWHRQQIAGHDCKGSPITVHQLIDTLEGYERLACIASMPNSMRDNLAAAAGESYRVKRHNEQLQRTVKELEDQLNASYSRITTLLNELAASSNNTLQTALAHYANPQNWRNPYDQHGEVNTQQRSVFAKGYHGYEIAMAALKNTSQAA